MKIRQSKVKEAINKFHNGQNGSYLFFIVDERYRERFDTFDTSEGLFAIEKSRENKGTAIRIDKEGPNLWQIDNTCLKAGDFAHLKF